MDNIAGAVGAVVSDTFAVRLQNGARVAEVADDYLRVFAGVLHVVAIIGTETVPLAGNDVGYRRQG